MGRLIEVYVDAGERAMFRTEVDPAVHKAGVITARLAGEREGFVRGALFGGFLGLMFGAGAGVFAMAWAVAQ